MKSTAKIVCFVAASLLLLVASGFAQRSALPSGKRAALLDSVKAVHAKQKNVGLAASVMLNGTIVFSETLGLADLEQDISVSKETLFPVASVTKAFTAAALLKLYEEGRIDLDAPIQRYVPDFPRKGTETITLRLLAAHLAGIRHYRPNEKTPEFLSKHYDNVNDALSIFKDDSLVAETGTKYSYSSFGYNLIAAAIQQAAGKPYAQFIEETIFKPLHLEHTSFDDTRKVVRHRARSYSWVDLQTFAVLKEPVRAPDGDYSYNMGGGNILTTAEDLVKFGQAFVKPGFFSAKTLEMFYTAQRTPKAESPWSYGWFVRRDSSGHRYLQISGTFAAIQAGVVVFPDQGIVVAVTSNTWGVGASSGELVIGLPERMAKMVGGW